MQICRSEGRVRDLTYDHSLTAKMMLYLVYPLFILLLPMCLGQVAVVLQQQLLGLNWGWRSMPSYCYFSLWACNCMWLYSKETNAFFSTSVKYNFESVSVAIVLYSSNYAQTVLENQAFKESKTHKIIVDCWTFMITMAFFSDFLILVLLIMCILYITLLLFI